LIFLHLRDEKPFHVPELNLTLNKVERQKISMAVGLLAVVEDEAVRMMTQEPDLDVESLAHVTQGRKLDKAEIGKTLLGPFLRIETYSVSRFM
jgi:hypothetical protein